MKYIAEITEEIVKERGCPLLQEGYCPLTYDDWHGHKVMRSCGEYSYEDKWKRPEWCPLKPADIVETVFDAEGLHLKKTVVVTSETLQAMLDDKLSETIRQAIHDEIDRRLRKVLEVPSDDMGG